jgi:nitrogen fixation protein FixH
LWIPALFVAFFIGLAGLEAWFVTIARTTFSGLVTDHAYDVGLAYNAVIATKESEARVGWSSSFRFDQSGPLGGRVNLSLVTSDGKPVAGASIHATAELMSRFPQILPVIFSETEGGNYTANVRVPLVGRWFIRVKATRNEQTIHRIDEIGIAP